jgi:hypothetical protein
MSFNPVKYKTSGLKSMVVHFSQLVYRMYWFGRLSQRAVNPALTLLAKAFNA